MAEPVTVRFYSYSRLGTERVFRHLDSFVYGNYRFDQESVETARGPAGFVF